MLINEQKGRQAHLDPQAWSGYVQGKLTINNRYTQREFQLKFSALLKDDAIKYAENSKK